MIVKLFWKIIKKNKSWTVEYIFPGVAHEHKPTEIYLLKCPCSSFIYCFLPVNFTAVFNCKTCTLPAQQRDKLDTSW